MGLPIHDEQAQEEEAENEEGEQLRDVVAPKGTWVSKIGTVVDRGAEGEEPRGGDGTPKAKRKLNGRIAPGDISFAVSAAATEQKPTQERDVVVPANGVTTPWAVGARVDDGFAGGNARDTDIEKAAEQEADGEADELDGVEGHRLEYKGSCFSRALT